MRNSNLIPALLFGIGAALIQADAALAQSAPRGDEANSRVVLLPAVEPVYQSPPANTYSQSQPVRWATENQLSSAAYPAASAPSAAAALDTNTNVAPGSSWLGEACSTCDACPRHCFDAFMGYDSWRGLPDGDWGHNGLHTGVNFGTRLGELSERTGIGFQIGASAGVYDFNGADYHMKHGDQAQVQGFLTSGFFRRATDVSPWSVGIVQDWMFNHNYSEFAENPVLGQLRGQIGYTINDRNEFGVWGSVRDISDSRTEPVFGTTRWQAINETSIFWHHKWELGADSVIGFGIPEHERMTGNGSLGDYIATATANAPLNDRVALYTLVSYMHPSAAPGDPGSAEDTWAFMIGLAFYPSYSARSSNVRGQCWAPLMPIANNGSFLVDTNNFY